MPSAAGIISPYRHIQPRAPAAASVGGGASGDQSNFGQALRNHRGPFPDVLQGWGVPVLRMGDSLIPGESCIGGGPHPCPGAGDPSRSRTRLNGASISLIILCLGLPLLH